MDARAAKFVLIPPGLFRMGSPDDDTDAQPDEKPMHHVQITRAFLLQETEVTQAQWRDVMGTNPSKHQDCGLDCPVDFVSWNDAVQYLNRLSEREHLPACYTGSGESWDFLGLDCPGYRLPTEAEWEYAARAGTNTAFYNGKNISDPNQFRCAPEPNLDDIAWYCDGTKGAGPHRVAQKQPNLWGLYDMLGNVYEWTNDWYDALYYGVRPNPDIDPLGPPPDQLRVLRSGSWKAIAVSLRAGYRAQSQQDHRQDIVGLRAARTSR